MVPDDDAPVVLEAVAESCDGCCDCDAMSVGLSNECLHEGHVSCPLLCALNGSLPALTAAVFRSALATVELSTLTCDEHRGHVAYGFFDRSK